MRINANLLSTVALALSGASMVSAGPIAYGLCQTDCNTVAVACYADAGFTFGTVAAADAPAAVLACNSALGTCSAKCASVTLLAPTS
ncbi:hypothetical protein CPC08DRAFT_712746 [Agrocybe pediades]|nr:hypothetical protein CPC08DRAFT_712746 [Agrocybe pediades]